jgi:hypothetical protein
MWSMMAGGLGASKGELNKPGLRPVINSGIGGRESLNRAAHMRRLVFAGLVLSLTGCLHKGFLDDTPQGIPGYRNVGQPQTPVPWYTNPAAAFAATRTPTK